jgi:hypothetical protein
VVVGIKHAYGDVWEEWVLRMQRRGIKMANAREMVKVMGLKGQEDREGTELGEWFIRLTRRVVERE